MKKYSKRFNNRRKFLELINFLYLSVLLLPFNLLHAATKKIINQNLTAKIFASTAKFDSGTGWLSFKEPLPGAFKTKIDYSFGMKRVEYHCAKCAVHHEHVFDVGSTSTQKRFCSNELCLIFKPVS